MNDSPVLKRQAAAGGRCRLDAESEEIRSGTKLQRVLRLYFGCRCQNRGDQAASSRASRILSGRQRESTCSYKCFLGYIHLTASNITMQ